VAWVFRTAKNAAHNLKVGRTADVIFSPPPSLRDTSASGGQKIVVSPGSLARLQSCRCGTVYVSPPRPPSLLFFRGWRSSPAGGNILHFVPRWRGRRGWKSNVRFFEPPKMRLIT
jgi:hypothetical protein